MINRDDLANLKTWLERDDRKPLIIRGARQVGKTYLIRQLAESTSKQCVELNFEKNPQLKTLFTSNDPQSILMQLESYFNITINPDTAILFLDEIQTAPELVAKLRWFYEEMPELPTIATGSLLDFVLEDYQYSMPVGRINYYHLEPLIFSEFINAQGDHKLLQLIKNYQFSETIADVIHQRLLNLVKEYILIGGLPEAVNTWVTKQSFVRVNEVHNNIVATYRDDFAKYPSKISRERLEDILNAVPKMLGKKFKYSLVNRDVQSSTLKNALHLLCTARICHRVIHSSGNGVPLAAESRDKNFKIILLDIGLGSAALGLELHNKTPLNSVQFANQGGLSEQFVGQQLRALYPSYIEPALYYWAREQKTSSAEVDYLIQHGSQVIPIEVKSGSTGSLKSLHLFMYEKKLPLAVRINGDQPSVVDIAVNMQRGEMVKYKLLSIPFYLIGEIHRLIEAMHI